jgi:hypothetical protein
MKNMINIVSIPIIKSLMFLEFEGDMGKRGISSLSDKIRGRHCKDNSPPIVCSWKVCQTMKGMSRKKDDPYWSYLLKNTMGE